jgi:mRNA interferase RelE/StbE
LFEFRILETTEFRKSLAKLPPAQSAFIDRKLGAHIYPQLRAQPYFGPNIGKLRGWTPETWRYRLGRYRLFYLIDADARIIYMLTADDRKDAYRRT